MADGSDRPDDLLRFVRTMDERGVDCVFGTRFSGGGKTVGYPLPKLLLNRAANNIIRALFGIHAIRRAREPIDGINIIILLVFVSAVMGSVAGDLWANPLQVAGLTLLAFAIFFALVGATMLVFRRLGYERALALGLLVSQRNMGLMVAATGGALPGLTWLYFALPQFPIYLSPQLLEPIVRKLKLSRRNGLRGEPD